MAPATINPVAQSGFEDATSYDAYRPSYPSSAVSAFLQHLDIDNALNARIVDLAAGTGKFTELLAQREEDYDIIAVEPHVGMREVLEKKKLKTVKVVEGTATNMSAVEARWADSVVVAQVGLRVGYEERANGKWNYTGFPLCGVDELTKSIRSRFANEEALREIHRVLKPCGTLGLIWNIEDYNSPTDSQPSTEWERKLKEIIWTLDDESHRFRHNEWRRAFEEQTRSTPLTVASADPIFTLPLGEDSVKWTVWLEKDAVWHRFHTISHIANLKGEKLEETKNKVYEILNGSDVELNDKGEVALHGMTFYGWTTAVPGSPLRNGG
ncbi:hypothetical protein MMC13_006622 [Lambiella insularis]|nr:hypothetical protein [Lambiella insularis]